MTPIVDEITGVAHDTWDCFGFRYQKDVGLRCTPYRETMARLGVQAQPGVPTDRLACHVLLARFQGAQVLVEPTFLSHFLDPLVYAEGRARDGYIGFMVRQSPWSEEIVSILEQVLSTRKESV